MRDRLIHNLSSVGLAMLVTLVAAHVADRTAYGLHMKARGLAPAHQVGVMP